MRGFCSSDGVTLFPAKSATRMKLGDTALLSYSISEFIALVLVSGDSSMGRKRVTSRSVFSAEATTS